MKRVLIVDDVPVIAELLSVYIDIDALVTTITTDFTELTDPTHPVWSTTDVLVCDLLLPLVSGLDILQTVRDHHPHIRRITLTGVSRGPIFETAVELSDQVMVKTTPLSEILEVILR